MTSGILFAAAFALSLYIQTTASLLWPLIIALCIGGLIAMPLDLPKPRFSWPLAALGAWAVWVASSALVFRAAPASPLFMAHLLAIPAYVYAVSRIRDPFPVLKKHTMALAVPLAALAGVIVWQFMIDGQHRAAGWFLNANNAGAMMAGATIAAAGAYLHAGKQRYLWLAGLFALALIGTGSRGGLMACAAGVGLIAFFGGKTPRKIGDLIGIFGTVFVLSLVPGLLAIGPMLGDTLTHGVAQSGMDRLALWRSSVDMANDQPLLGWGLGTFHEIYPRYRNGDLTSGGYFAHNDPLQFAAEMGWPAFALFYAICLSFAASVTRATLVPFCVLLAVVAHTHIDFHLYIFSINMILALSAGWFVALRNDPARDILLKK